MWFRRFFRLQLARGYGICVSFSNLVLSLFLSQTNTFVAVQLKTRFFGFCDSGLIGQLCLRFLIVGCTWSHHPQSRLLFAQRWHKSVIMHRKKRKSSEQMGRKRRHFRLVRETASDFEYCCLRREWVCYWTDGHCGMVKQQIVSLISDRCNIPSWWFLWSHRRVCIIRQCVVLFFCSHFHLCQTSTLPGLVLPSIHSPMSLYQQKKASQLDVPS